MRAFLDDRYDYDEERLALVGRNSGRVLGPGFELTVRIDAVDIERGDIVLGFPEVAAPAASPTNPVERERRRFEERKWKKRRDR